MRSEAAKEKTGEPNGKPINYAAEMQRSFRQMTRFQYGAFREIPYAELKQAILCFAFGWMNSAQAAGNEELLKQCEPVCERIFQSEWIPDNRWMHWHDPDAQPLPPAK